MAIASISFCFNILNAFQVKGPGPGDPRPELLKEKVTQPGVGPPVSIF